MLKASLHTFINMFRLTLSGCQKCSHPLTSVSLLSAKYKLTCLPRHCYTDERTSYKENKRILDSLCRLNVDVQKIRRLKSWVLSRDKAYVQETATILTDMGANSTTIASVLERCPEAILQPPEVIQAQQYLWRSVYPDDKELVKVIERFPESFFTFMHKENQTRNIQYFQELGIKKKIISRFLATAPDIFCNSVNKNKRMIEALQESYLKLGGSEANMKVWLVKLLCQDPFIFSKSPGAVKNNLECFQKLGLTDSEVLMLLSKLKGFIFDVTSNNMESSAVYTKNIFKCNDKELKQMVLNCPALLYYTVSVLTERIEGLLTEGISIEQIKKSPSVLELTTQIVQHRIMKIASLGYNIKYMHLEQLIGTKKDFEVSFNKIQPKAQRPLFNPVAPLDVDD